MNAEMQSPPQQTNELLQRILKAILSRMVRTVLADLAVVLFLATLAGLLTMPICHES
jgi:hypothetical protein